MFIVSNNTYYFQNVLKIKVLLTKLALRLICAIAAGAIFVMP